MTPRDGGLRTDDAVGSHRAVGGGGASARHHMVDARAGGLAPVLGPKPTGDRPSSGRESVQVSNIGFM
jgi:hypothetical protein